MTAQEKLLCITWTRIESNEAHPPAIAKAEKLEADKAAAQVSARVPNHLSPSACAVQSLDDALPLGLVEIL